MHHCFDLSCVALAIVLIVITTSSYDTGLLSTRMDNQPFFPHIEFHDNVYRMPPRPSNTCWRNSSCIMASLLRNDMCVDAKHRKWGFDQQ
jgi:hypothetical protein